MTVKLAQPPDAMILLAQLEKAARAGQSAVAKFYLDDVRAVIGRGGRVWFTINNGPRLYTAKAIEALDQIEGIEQRRATLIAAEKEQ